jgi:hypothetical protein
MQNSTELCEVIKSFEYVLGNAIRLDCTIQYTPEGAVDWLNVRSSGVQVDLENMYVRNHGQVQALHDVICFAAAKHV